MRSQGERFKATQAANIRCYASCFEKKFSLLLQWSWQKLGHCMHPSFVWFFKQWGLLW